MAAFCWNSCPISLHIGFLSSYLSQIYTHRFILCQLWFTIASQQTSAVVVCSCHCIQICVCIKRSWSLGIIHWLSAHYLIWAGIYKEKCTALTMCVSICTREGNVTGNRRLAHVLWPWNTFSQHSEDAHICFYLCYSLLRMQTYYGTVRIIPNSNYI